MLHAKIRGLKILDANATFCTERVTPKRFKQAKGEVAKCRVFAIKWRFACIDMAVIQLIQLFTMRETKIMITAVF